MSEREILFGHPTGVDAKTGERFVFFWRSASVFSQWHPSVFEFRGERFETAEQWMMAGKARRFGDEEVRAKILATSSPEQQKSLGRKVRGFDADAWTAASFGVVYAGSWLKFARGTRRGDALVETAGYTLVEASPLDCIWGIGLAAEHDEASRRAAWRGENRLGRVLTELRDDMARGGADDRARAFLEAAGV